MKENGFLNSRKYSDTDIDKVKQLNAQSGMSYQEVKQALARQFASKNKES
ncbi:hypothetical protein RFW18_18495 [Metabacillus idriensis]|nr:hypothetical protein [Metabacillus idriensis]MDR0139748.1 hypothetical protein [Metabacillus idriensis]